MSYKVKRITTIGMLIAMEVVLSRFLAITIPPTPQYLVKITLSFLPVAVAAILYGPLWGGACAALADILGTVLFQPGAMYFPGFTLTAFLTGVFFGIFVYEKKIRFLNSLFAALCNCILCSFGLNTLWLYILYKDSVVAMIPGRAANAAAMIVVETAALLFLGKVMGPYIKKVRGERAQQLRGRARQYFKLNPQLRESVSAGIARNVFALPEYKAAGTVLIFVGTDREPDTAPIIDAALAAGKTVCLPISEDDETMTAHRISSRDELSAGRFGILEPPHTAPQVTAEEIDLALVPCAVCDRHRRRVGKGGGYYDHFLADARMFKAAICPSALVQGSVPQNDHDVLMDAVVTEKSVIR